MDQGTVKSNPSVAVVGAGVIGLSWAALFAAKGYQVKVFDPRADLAAAIQDFIPHAVVQIPGMQENVSAIVNRVVPVTDVEEAVRGVVAVQEAGPEKPEFKQALWVQIEQYVGSEALLLSSSSGIPASVQSIKMKQPLRLVIGHPFNPPHILPLVEISAAAETPQAVIDAAMAFYRMLGKYPVQLHQEIAGFVANRLQIALINEAVKIVEAGVVSPKELDDIMTHSLGIRWASVGPLLAFHLGGGAGGLHRILTHIGVSLAQAIGQGDVLTSQAIDAVSRATEQDYAFARFAEYAQERDRRQAVIIADHESHPSQS